MRVLFVYPNAQGYARIPIGISLLMTILDQKGHKVELFDTTFMMTGENMDSAVREKAGLVVPTDTSRFFEKHSTEEIDGIFLKKVKEFGADMLAVSILEDNYQLADHLMGVFKREHRDKPVIVGGSTPTVAPEIVMENPNVDYLVQGEGEGAMAEFCELTERGKPVEDIMNLWFKKDGKIMHNRIRPFVDINTMPVQDLRWWGEGHFLKPYDGKVYRTGYIEMSRGCMNRCSYCINSACQDIFKGAGKYYRQKTIPNVMKEIKALEEKHRLEMIFFADDNFLLMSRPRLQEFAEAWKREIKLPYWINSTVEAISRDRLKLLKETGCCGIGLGLESGSEWFRANVLNKGMNDNRRIKSAFDLMHESGIRTTANVMIGFPGEHEADIFESIKMIRNVMPKSTNIHFVAPYTGTALHAASKMLGYIDTIDRPGFRGMAKDVSMRNGPVVRNPYMKRERIVEIYYDFMNYVNGKLPMPQEYSALAPGANGSAPERGDMSKDVADVFRSLNNSGGRNAS
ncbi:MAG: radical SAM protein [Candidatus Omnitrophica bacterium]|nr:radical SAM protein [Candidatus Omnitrophota bacterium]MDD5736832.1 radical SAM protein [Candidatus Omnitrophota bacterium]